MELGETEQHPLLKVDKVTKTVTHPFHCFKGVVHPLDPTRRESMSELVQYRVFPVVDPTQEWIQIFIVHIPGFFYPPVEFNFTVFPSPMRIENRAKSFFMRVDSLKLR